MYHSLASFLLVQSQISQYIFPTCFIGGMVQQWPKRSRVTQPCSYTGFSGLQGCSSLKLWYAHCSSLPSLHTQFTITELNPPGCHLHWARSAEQITHLPFLVTIISLVTSLNLCQSVASSKTTWSCFSVGSPLSLPARSSLSTTLRSLETVQSLGFLQPRSAMTTLLPETSGSCWKDKNNKLNKKKEVSSLGTVWQRCSAHSFATAWLFPLEVPMGSDTSVWRFTHTLHTKRGLSPNYLLDSQVGGWLMTQLAALKEESSIQISMLLSFFNLKWV